MLADSSVTAIKDELMTDPVEKKQGGNGNRDPLPLGLLSLIHICLERVNESMPLFC